ncbi:MAG: ComEC/Rec2 family competence protein [Verrucomicrobiota bacterium]
MKRRLGRFGRHHPLFIAALMTVAAVTAARTGAEWIAPVLGLSIACGWLLWNWRGAVACAACVLVAAGVFTVRTNSRDYDERTLLARRGGHASGRLCDDARGGGGRWQGIVRLNGEPSAKVWWQGKGDVPTAGAKVDGQGAWRPLPVPRNEGAFDEREWLVRQGVAAVFVTGGNATAVSTGRWAAFSARMRNGFRAAVTEGMDPASPEAEVIRAIVVGDMPRDSDVLVDAFRRSGTLHVFSVSGLHVVLVAGIGWFVLKWCGVPRRAAIPMLIVLVFGYSWITGHSAPAIRSAWMTSVFFTAFVFRRRPDLLNALGGVLLCATLFDGRLLLQPGVQLSYGVVAAIALGAEVTKWIFAWIGRRELYVPDELLNFPRRMEWKVRRKIATSLGVSAAAAVGSAPLTVWHFGMFTPVSIVAGLVIVPLVTGMLALALFAAALHPFLPAVSRASNRVNALLARCSIFSAAQFAKVPLGCVETQIEREPVLRVYDLEYGAGAACFSAGGSGVMLDCGSRESFRYEMLPSLRRLGIRPDSVVLSHPDGGHMGGASQVWRALPVKQVVLPVDEARSPAFREWKNFAVPAGVSVLRARHVGRLPLADEAWLEILHLPDPDHLHLIADKRVAVFRLHWRGLRVLFTSDAGYDTEQAMKRSDADLRADIIVAGRSLEGLSLTDEFLDAVKPQIIIAANPSHPPEQQLTQSEIGRWRARGIAVLDQREAGGVSLRMTGDGQLACTGFLGGFARVKSSGSAAGASVFLPPPTAFENPSSDRKTNLLPTAPP